MTIKKFTNPLKFLFPFTLLLILTACGGGSSPSRTNATAQKVTVTFSLQGAPVTIYSAQIDVVLPAGFLLEMDTTSNPPTPAASALSLLISGAEIAGANYIPESVEHSGVIIASISKKVGFAGNSSLMQISRTYAAGTTLPTADDFTVTLLAGNTEGVEIGYSAITSITTVAAY